MIISSSLSIASCLTLTNLFCMYPFATGCQDLPPYYVIFTSTLPDLPCCSAAFALYIGDSHSTFVHSLAERVLSVDPFLKPKYIYSGILADHVSVVTMLQVRPHLPLEIMDAMGYQSLAPHVSHKHTYMYMHTQQGCGSSACYGVKLNGDVVEQSLSKGVKLQ